MNSLTRVALTALALTFVPIVGAGAQAATKIGYVNSQKLLPQSPGFADAQQEMETQSEGVKAQEQKMSDSLAAAVQDYQKVQGTLTSAQKAQREQALAAKRQEYMQRAQQLEGRMQQRQAELMQPIMDQIRAVIERMRSEGGYALILDVGTQSGVVVAFDSTADITDKVLAKVIEAGPPKTAGKTTKPATKPPAAAASTPTGVTRPPTPPRGR